MDICDRIVIIVLRMTFFMRGQIQRCSHIPHKVRRNPALCTCHVIGSARQLDLTKLHDNPTHDSRDASAVLVRQYQAFHEEFTHVIVIVRKSTLDFRVAGKRRSVIKDL